MKKNALYAQSGGVTAVINASASGVIEACRDYKDKIGALYAAQNGIIGALQENLIDTSLESDQSIATLRHIPGGAFGSCRYKMRDMADDDSEYQRLIQVFKAHNIGYFFLQWRWGFGRYLFKGFSNFPIYGLPYSGYSHP